MTAGLLNVYLTFVYPHQRCFALSMYAFFKPKRLHAQKEGI